MGKRVFGVLQVFCLLLLFTSTHASAADTKYISIIAGSSGASWYLVAAGQANVINKYIPNVEAVAEPGGGAENIIRVAKKEVMLGITMSDNAYYAARGEREYRTKYPQIRAIMGGHDNPMKLITRKDSGINTVADLKGKKVGLGYPGSGQAIASATIMECLGLKPDKDFTAQWLTPAEVAQALQDKTIDAGFIYIADPTGLIIELANSTPIKFISFDLVKLLKENPYWYETVVPGGTYKGIDEDYHTQGANVMLICHEDADADFIYLLTKTLYEHVDEVGEVHPAGKEWNPDNAVRGVTIPFHPGAEKYLKEIGKIK